MTDTTDPANAAAAERRRRLARLADVLACPVCHTPLQMSDEACTCGGCGAVYPIRDGRLYFVQPQGSVEKFDDIKGRLKRLFGGYYRLIANTVSPCFPVFRKRTADQLFDTGQDLVIDCGSGTHRVDENTISLDFSEYENVDIVCDICARLPFIDGALDGSMSWGVIEHLGDPETFVAELARVTKPGGKTVHMIPFLYHFHSSPYDFVRFTDQGLIRLLQGFRVRDVTNAAGPVSYFLLGFVEFWATVLSFNHQGLKSVIYLGLCSVTFPIKLLDWPFINRKAFIPMAPQLLVIGERPAEPAAS